MDHDDYEPMEPKEMDENGRHLIDLEVDLIHQESRIAILSDGQEIPITSWFREGDAEPCFYWEAVSCVAGPDSNGRWYSIDLRQFTGRVQ